jgi:hypothetical protein
MMMLLLAAFASGCGPRCDNAVTAELTSPSGGYVATVYERDCGATTDFSTLVNIRAASTQFDANQGIVFVVRGRRVLNISWKSNKNLNIDCADCVDRDVFRREGSWNGMAISYHLQGY